MKHLTLTLLALLTCLSVPAQAQFDPELNQGYEIDVVLKVARNRLLTPVFRQQVQRELADGLQAALGKVAKVKVLTDHPRLSDDLKSLDSWKELTGKKTHFILIDFKKGRYQLQARQHDGYTGQASPVIRKASTADRPFVARLATLLINRDFGIVASLPKGSKPEEVMTIKIKGAKLGEQFLKGVKAGDVFRVVPIYVGRQRAWPIPHAVLQVISEPNPDGECKCQFYHRYVDPLADAPGLLTFRCLKLGTIRAPVSVRFVQRGRKLGDVRPVEELIPLEIRQKKDSKQADISTATDGDGFYSSRDLPEKKGVFSNLVHVKARLGRDRYALIPIPIVSEEPVLLAVTLQQPGQQDALERDVARWKKRAHDYDRVLLQVFNDLSKLDEDPKKVQAGVDRAKADLKRSEDALTKLKKQRDQLERKIRTAGKDPKTMLEQGDKSLVSLAEGHKDLLKFIDGQEKILAAKDNPKVKEWLARIEKAKLAERDADFELALKIYDEVTAEDGFNDQSVVKRRDKLRQMWEVKDEEHRKARTFIYTRWPQLDTAEKMQQEMQSVKDALGTIAARKDKLTTQKFIKVANDHVSKLNAQKEGLRTDINQEDFDLAKIMDKVLVDMEALLVQAAGILGG